MNATPTSDLASPLVLRAADPQQNNGRREVAFIDKGVADYQTLVDGVRAGVEVVLLDAGQDGLAQMALWAQSHSGYDAIHVLSHGSEGTLRLGRNTVTQSSLSDAGVQAELATLGQALTADGDLLIYGCSVAAGEAGQAFVANLAAVTGADVAASDDLTGASGLGGDWKLESKKGFIDTEIISNNDKYSQVLSSQITTNGLMVIAYNARTSDTAVSGYLGSLYDESFTLVTFEDIQANSTIFVTDIGFRSNGTLITGSGNDLEGQSFSSYNDGVLQWSTGSSIIVAGTVIRFKPSDSLYVSHGTIGQVSGIGTGLFNLSNAGDKIAVYQTSDNQWDGSFLRGNSSGGTESGIITQFQTNDLAAGNGFSTTTNESAFESYAHQSLTVYDGTNASSASAIPIWKYSAGGEKDNYIYDGDVTTASIATWQARFVNPSNYLYNDGAGFDFTQSSVWSIGNSPTISLLVTE